jgi:autotransporter-associated beta strand protein
LLNGQTLRGAGTVGGAVTVDSGATLTVGGNSGTPATLTFNNNLTLNGSTTLRLNNSGASDLLTGIGTLQAGGVLNLANVGPALANGNSFTLFSATSISGNFTIFPITPGAGLAWDQSQLSSGIIAVTLAPSSPVISPPLGNQTVECGANATFTAVANGTAPLYFRWSSNSVAVSAWTTNNPNSFTFTNIHANGSTYTISVDVTNSAGNASSSATLTVQDTSAPVVTMIGSNVMNVVLGTSFVDPGATAADACEGSLAVVTNGTVDVNTAGTYLITYTATDSMSLSSSASRTVNVNLGSSAWTNLVSGVWSAPANWLNAIVANGNTTVADFSTIDVTNDVTVSLDSARTIGGLTFGDLTNTNAAGWTVDNNGNAANVLTLQRLDAASPVISVGTLGTGKSTTISARIAGTTGLSKTGAGTLDLSGNNNYSGTTMIANGTLVIGGSFTSIQSEFALTNSNTTLRFASNANYTLSQGITFSDNTANANETLSIEGGAEVLSHGLNVGNNGAQDTWFTGGGTLRLTNSTSTYSGRFRMNNLTFIIDNGAVFNNNNPNVASQIGSGAVPNAPANSTGVMTVRGNGQYIQSQQGLRLGSDANGATGILNVQDSAVVTVPLLYLPRQSGNIGIANQNGGTVTTTSIQGGGGGTWSGTYNLNGGTLAWGGVFATGPTAAGQTMMLNLNGGILQFTAGATVAGWSAINVDGGGAIIDTAGNAVTFTDALIAGDAFGGGLTKTGAGTLTLSGANNYTGNTTVNAGTLELAQPVLAATAKVIVTNGAVLQLDFAVTNTVAALILNGVTKSPGVYNNSTDPTYLTGTGSLQVAATVATNPTNITFTVSGNSLILSWPADHTGWHLQAQTNSLTSGLGTNWVTIPNTDLGNSYTNTINPANGAVFYRMILP